MQGETVDTRINMDIGSTREEHTIVKFWIMVSLIALKIASEPLICT